MLGEAKELRTWSREVLRPWDGKKQSSWSRGMLKSWSRGTEVPQELRSARSKGALRSKGRVDQLRELGRTRSI